MGACGGLSGAIGADCYLLAFYANTNMRALTAKISNTKHQIANKSQITISNDQT